MKVKKRIGIVTFQNSDNFGAMYQSYALSQYLKKNGCEVFILDYDMTRDSSTFIEHLVHPVAFVQKIIYKRDLIVNMLKDKKKDNSRVNRKSHFVEIFDIFRKKYLNITEAEYDYKKLSVDCPKAYAYICGSDQVWSADFFFTSPAFLLGFVPKGIKKIAYAPSFGKNKLESYIEKTFSTHIKQFDAISVREKTGVEIVKNLSNCDATHVLDPTLLLTKLDYSEIIDYSLVPNEPYIFVYKLRQEKELSNWMSDTINMISEKDNLPVLAVSTNSPWAFPSKWNEIYPTPGQMLGIIEKSSLTVTNSFHGTVFSIILQAKFMAFARDKYEDKQNIRMTELLSSLGLSAFYCRPFLNYGEIENKLSQEYNYDETEFKLDALRATSKQFLKKALS